VRASVRQPVPGKHDGKSSCLRLSASSFAAFHRHVAHIRARYPISYANAFAVITAQDQQSTLLTGDPEFRSVSTDGLISIEWLPRH
jgi:hypothetical protein